MRKLELGVVVVAVALCMGMFSAREEPVPKSELSHTVVGRVVEVDGTLRTMRRGEYQRVDRYPYVSDLTEGESMDTAADNRVRLELNDGGSVTLEEQSALVVDSPKAVTLREGRARFSGDGLMVTTKLGWVVAKEAEAELARLDQRLLLEVFSGTVTLELIDGTTSELTAGGKLEIDGKDLTRKRPVPEREPGFQGLGR